MELAHVRPVYAYMIEAIRWGISQGKKRMILGGGYQPGDGVFRFKANFSPLRARFCTYRRIRDAKAYAALTQAWSTYNQGPSPTISSPPTGVPMPWKGQSAPPQMGG